MIASDAETKQWLLIADGIKATVYEVYLRPLRVQAVQGLELHGKNLRTRDLESDRPGVSFESVGGARHAIERHGNAQRREKEHFAARVAVLLDHAARDHAFHGLTVVAPPATLGDLRKEFTPEVTSRIQHEIHGDWTKLGVKDLVQHLSAHMQPGARA